MASHVFCRKRRESMCAAIIIIIYPSDGTSLGYACGGEKRRLLRAVEGLTIPCTAAYIFYSYDDINEHITHDDKI